MASANRNLGMQISIVRSLDGRVRLTTKSGTSFDAAVLRHEFVPRKVLIVEPIDFTVAFGEFVPELLRVVEGQLQAADRVEGPTAMPDVDKLRKALEWPTELPPKATAAAIKRAESALTAAASDGAPEPAVRQAIEVGASRGLAAVVARLEPAARARLLEHAVETGAGPALALLLAGDRSDINLPRLFALAAVRGKLLAVEALLAAGADPDTVAPYLRGDHELRSALYWAVQHGHRAVVRRLLQVGARVTDSAALTWAIVHSPDLGTWKLLLAAGLDVDARDHHGDPLLFALGRNGKTAFVDATLAAGADANAGYADGSTLLLHAIDLASRRDGGSTYFIEQLLAAGADPNAGRLHGHNPLALALVVPHDPGERHGERWIAGWLTRAGAVAAADPDAPALLPEAPPAPPPWRARIDASLPHGGRYEVAGVRFEPTTIAATFESVTTARPRWTGLGCDDIAVARAKLEHLVGPPLERGDEYKTTFEYTFLATVKPEGAPGHEEAVAVERMAIHVPGRLGHRVVRVGDQPFAPPLVAVEDAGKAASTLNVRRALSGGSSLAIA